MLSSLGQAATIIARLGLPVFPLWPRAKTPQTGDGFKSATMDLEQIRKWWERSPDSNIGVSLAVDLVVVDIDNTEALLNLQALGDLAETVRTKTPRGWHYWYRIPAGERLQPRVGVVPGVDVRTVGSYVVVPPSVNEHGVRWYWEAEPDIEKFAVIPPWLKALLETRPPGVPHYAPGLVSAEILSGVNEGQRDATLFRYACKLRGEGRDRKEAEVLVLHAARSCSPPFPADEAIRKLEQAWKYPDGKAPGRDEEIRIWTAPELLQTAFSEPLWFVKDILPEGLTLLVSPAKVGKSFLMGNITAAVALGGRALGALSAQKSGVLYLDLEESERRAKGRWQNILSGCALPPSLYTAFSWPRLHDGGLEKLAETLTARPEIGLVVIHVLSKFWPPDADEGGGNAYHREYKILSEIKDFVRTKRLGMVLVHHTNRTQQVDPLDRVSGTNAMTGVPDAIWILKRERAKTGGELYITGRHVEETTLRLVWSPVTGSWCVDKDQEREERG